MNHLYDGQGQLDELDPNTRLYVCQTVKTKISQNFRKSVDSWNGKRPNTSITAIYVNSFLKRIDMSSWIIQILFSWDSDLLNLLHT